MAQRTQVLSLCECFVNFSLDFCCLIRFYIINDSILIISKTPSFRKNNATSAVFILYIPKYKYFSPSVAIHAKMIDRIIHSKILRPFLPLRTNTLLKNSQVQLSEISFQKTGIKLVIITSRR